MSWCALKLDQTELLFPDIHNSACIKDFPSDFIASHECKKTRQKKFNAIRLPLVWPKFENHFLNYTLFFSTSLVLVLHRGRKRRIAPKNVFVSLPQSHLSEFETDDDNYRIVFMLPSSVGPLFTERKLATRNAPQPRWKKEKRRTNLFSDIITQDSVHIVSSVGDCTRESNVHRNCLMRRSLLRIQMNKFPIVFVQRRRQTMHEKINKKKLSEGEVPPKLVERISTHFLLSKSRIQDKWPMHSTNYTSWARLISFGRLISLLLMENYGACNISVAHSQRPQV